jgi:pimeloyl-ACP methyl ester carboxylesterase
MPVHVLWGRRDTVAPLSIAEAVMVDLPADTSTLTWLEDAGHFAMLEQPNVWADAVLNFYRSCHQPSSGWCSVIA